MTLSCDDVRAVAYEARLPLTDERGAARYMNEFLAAADRLKDLELKNVQPFRFPESSECPLREDAPERFGGISEILNARADASETSLFKVPRIMEE